VKRTSILAWYGQSQVAWRQVRLSHQLLLSAAPVACFTVLIVAFAMPVGELLATYFNVNPDAPLRGQPGEYAIIAVYIAALTGLVMVGCLLGSLLVALWLRYARGYTWAKVARISLHAEYPPHWLRT
jgi:hypothetical protein